MAVKDEADALLYDFNLLGILEKFGKVYITGSYFMDLMVWNDLDVYIEDNETSRSNFYTLIGEICTELKPSRLDGMAGDKGWFFGFETYATGERWNVDIWLKNKDEIKSAQESCAETARLINDRPECRKAVMDIKENLIERRLYGFDKLPAHYHSGDVYNAVLNEDARTYDEFLMLFPKNKRSPCERN